MSQHHHGFREPIFSSCKWRNKWKSTSKYQFLWTSITDHGSHHAHTLLYPSCTWTVLDTVFTSHSTAVDKSQIVSCWFSKTSSTTCAVFTCSWKVQSSWWMPTHFRTVCTVSLNDPVSVHHHQTPELTGSDFQGWKYSAYITCHTTKFSSWQSVQFHYHCT